MREECHCAECPLVSAILCWLRQKETVLSVKDEQTQNHWNRKAASSKSKYSSHPCLKKGDEGKEEEEEKQFEVSLSPTFPSHLPAVFVSVALELW